MVKEERACGCTCRRHSHTRNAPDSKLATRRTEAFLFRFFHFLQKIWIGIHGALRVSTRSAVMRILFVVCAAPPAHTTISIQTNYSVVHTTSCPTELFACLLARKPTFLWCKQVISSFSQNIFLGCLL